MYVHSQKMDEKLCFVYDLDWKCYKNGKKDITSKKKKKVFLEKQYFLPPPTCGFVNFINVW